MGLEAGPERRNTRLHMAAGRLEGDTHACAPRIVKASVEKDEPAIARVAPKITERTHYISAPRLVSALRFPQVNAVDA
jgi:hypothetical protein